MDFLTQVQQAGTIKEMRQALEQLLSDMPEDITNDGDARILKQVSQSLVLAGGKVGAVAKSYFRGY